MFVAEAKFDGGAKLQIDLQHVNQQAAILADAVTSTMVNYTKLAIVSYGAIASGDMLRETRGVMGAARSLMPFGVASHGTIRRQVVSNRSLKFVISGRRAGAKMPIRQVGTGPRGGKIFEPLPAVKRWFEVLGIPKSAWWPILRAISLRGIKPRNVPQRAVQQGMPAVQRHVQLAATNIARGLIKRGN